MLPVLATVEDARDDDFFHIDTILDDVGATSEFHDQLAQTGLRSRSTAFRKLAKRLGGGFKRIPRPQGDGWASHREEIHNANEIAVGG